mgnify:CR=1 FL=1
MIRQFFLITLILVFIIGVCQAVPEVWVDDDYSAGNAGSHTWGVDAFSNITNAIAAVDSGGIINVAAGLYNESISIGKSLQIKGPQAGVDPRTTAGLRTAGSVDEAILNGLNAFHAIHILNSDVTIDGLEVKNSSADCIYSGATLSNIVIRYCMIHDTGDEAIQIKNGTDCLMEYNLAYNNGQDGFSFAYSKNCTIRCSEVYNSTSDNAVIYTYGINTPCYGITIEGNYIHDCTASNGILAYQLYNTGGAPIVIRNNIIENCNFIGHKRGVDGCPISLLETTYQMESSASPSIIVEGNTVQNCTGTGTGSVTTGHGIYFRTQNASSVTDIPVLMEGNTLINNGGWGMKIDVGNSAGIVDHTTLVQNTFSGNAMGQVHNGATGITLSARYNYWGASTGPVTGDIAGNVDYTSWAYFSPVYRMLPASGGVVSVNPAINDRYPDLSVTINSLTHAGVLKLKTPLNRQGVNNAVDIVLEGASLAGTALIKIPFKDPDDLNGLGGELVRIRKWDGSNWVTVPSITNSTNWPGENSAQVEVYSFSLYAAIPDPTVPVELSIFSLE